MTINTSNAFKLADHLRQQFVLVRLTGTTKGVRKSAVYNEGLAAIADQRGGDRDLFASTKTLFPKGYDKELLTLSSAFADVRTNFNNKTVALKTQRGAGLLRSDPETRHELESSHAALIDKLDQARTAFATALPDIINRIEAAAVGWKNWQDFDRSLYPDPATVLASYQYEPLSFEPLASTDVRDIPVDRVLAEKLSLQAESVAQANYRYGLQAEAVDLTKKLQAMADVMTKLQEGTRTRVTEALFTNVSDITKKLRTYAIPETDLGARLLDLSEKIEDRLQLARLSPDAVKTSPTLTAATADTARSLASELGTLFEDF